MKRVLPKRGAPPLVAQASKPAVSQVSKLARRGSLRTREPQDALPTWKCGDTAGWETCATADGPALFTHPFSPASRPVVP